MSVTLARIDERLIHGQIAYSWTRAYPSDTVVVVDDGAAGDEFQITLLRMACPPALQCEVLGTDAATEYIGAHESQRLFLVAKTPGAFLRLVEGGITLPSVNVGGLYFAEGRRQISTTVYVDDALSADLRKLDDLGAKPEIRTAPSDRSVPVTDLL